MADNQGLNLTTEHETGVHWPEGVVKQVSDWAIDALGVPQDTAFYLVWFAFTLGNYKGLVSSTEPDGRYYEVTYNVDKKQTYIDTYCKTHNITIHEGKDIQ